MFADGKNNLGGEIIGSLYLVCWSGAFKFATELKGPPKFNSGEVMKRSHCQQIIGSPLSEGLRWKARRAIRLASPFVWGYWQGCVPSIINTGLYDCPLDHNQGGCEVMSHVDHREISARECLKGKMASQHKDWIGNMLNCSMPSSLCGDKLYDAFLVLPNCTRPSTIYDHKLPRAFFTLLDKVVERGFSTLWPSLLHGIDCKWDPCTVQ